MPKLLKRPAASEDAAGVQKKGKTEGGMITPQRFKELFLILCTSSACLPYPMEGGRRADLALSCGSWIRIQRYHGISNLPMAVMQPGFRAIHATRVAQDAEFWGVTDAQAMSWAMQMSKRLQLLNRHFAQAEASVNMPNWVKLILEPGYVVKEEKKEEDEQEDAANDEEEAEEEEEEADQSPQAGATQIDEEEEAEAEQPEEEE